jgi:hypothetical protein
MNWVGYASPLGTWCQDWGLELLLLMLRFANNILLQCDGGHLLFHTSMLRDWAVFRVARRKNLGGFPFKLEHLRARVYVHTLKVTVLG